MLLQKVLNILTMMPQKHQKLVMAQIDFTNNTPSEVYHRIIDTMLAVTKNAQQKEILQIYSEMTIKDEDILAAFHGATAAPLLPLSFTDEQIDYIRENVYRNRNGKYRIIPRVKNCSVDNMPLDGLDADEDILSAKLLTARLSANGSQEVFDGLKELKRQPYEGPYDGVYKSLSANISRVHIISSFEKNDPYGFFRRNGEMYRNVCSQLTTLNQDMVNDTSLRRIMLLLYLVSGGSQESWETLYRLIHFMVRVPNSATGYILYLNDFDAGGNGKSKFISVLQAMFGDSFTAFAPQQLRFTMSLMGKRLVSISEYEDNEASKPLQGLLKSMTGRDRFQYEGKGIDPVVADSYQNFVISSNRYIHFEDSGIKRRLQNFHCSNLLHLILNKYCRTHDYLNPLFGNIFNGEALQITKEMAHSLLDYIFKDDNTYSIPIRPQSIVLGSLKNPVLRNLFASNVNFDGFIRETTTGSAIDLFRLAADAKPEQLSYAASTLQSWFDDISFDISRDATTILTDVPEQVMIRRMRDRLIELDESSRILKSRDRVTLENATLNGFSSKALLNEFLGDAIVKYNIPMKDNGTSTIVGI